MIEPCHQNNTGDLIISADVVQGHLFFNNIHENTLVGGLWRTLFRTLYKDDPDQMKHYNS